MRIQDQGILIYETEILLHFITDRPYNVSLHAKSAFTTVSYQKVVKQMREVDKKKALMAKKALMVKKMNAAKAAAKKTQLAKRKPLAKKPVAKRRRVKQTFNNLVVLATNFNGVPKDTTDFTATLTRGSSTFNAFFDDTGVAIFFDVSTLTEFSYVLRIRNEDNTQVFQGTVPANREFFVARF